MKFLTPSTRLCTLARAIACIGIVGGITLGAAAQEQSPAQDPKAIEQLPAFVRTAEDAMEAEDWSSAVEAWQDAQRVAPDSAEVAYNLGVARLS